ncbi:MAG: ABC transporter ATP-binding protein [Xanthomonadales bacterium]|nr:ABC transporter ATP-binding protein [Xanthomonadales bacterium]
MSGAILLEAKGLGKRYPRTATGRQRLRALWHLLRGLPERDAVEVLKPLDLEVRRGESLAVIGENGAGKSTLLKLITGVLAPSSGEVRVHGRIGALLELGAGFHPELTGRENVRASALLHGLGAAEIEERMAAILDFADIGRAVDEPVKHYSSGMVVRLGFAVVTALRPELLITDEVLAVGDESFQKKCIAWLEDYVAADGTLLLVSHSMYHVQKLCRRAIWLKDGAVAASGEVFEVTQAYLAYHERKRAPRTEAGAAPPASGEIYRLLAVRLNGAPARDGLVLEQGAELALEAEVHSPDDRPPALAAGIVRLDGTPVYGLSSDMDGARPERIAPQRYRFRLRFVALPLLPGGYTVRVHPLDPEALRLFETAEWAFTVRGASREFGLVRLPHRWE